MILNSKKLETIKLWFKNYIDLLKSESPGNYRKINLKAEHSIRVSKIIKKIGRSIDINKKDIQISEIAGLLHDIGKIKQYSDDTLKKEDHAAYGVKILNENNVIDDTEIKDLIFETIKCHNKLEIPKEYSKESLIFSKLLRDADKLDLLDVLTVYYCKQDFSRLWIINIDLPDTPGISNNIFEAIMNNKVISSKYIKNMNDKKCSFLSWIFDVNYKESYRIIKKQNILEKIFSILPDKKVFADISNKICTYMNNQLER